MLAESGGGDAGEVSVILVEQIAGEIASVTADGANDGDPLSQRLQGGSPIRSRPLSSCRAQPRSSDRQMVTCRASSIVTTGCWERSAASAGRRRPAAAGGALAETRLDHSQSIIGPTLRAPSLSAQPNAVRLPSRNRNAGERLTKSAEAPLIRQYDQGNAFDPGVST